MNFHRLLGIALALFLCTPALGDEPAVPRAAIVDAMPAFWRIIDETADPKERIRRFRTEIVERHPEIYTQRQFERHLTDEALERYFEGVRQDLPAMRSLSAKIHTQTAAASERFAREFPAFDAAVSIAYLPSFYVFDGQLTRRDGRFALLFGLDGIARYHGENADLGVLLSHELFHIHHAHTTPSLFAEEEQPPLYTGIWIEGLATYVSERLNPQASTLQILLDDADLHARGPGMMPAIAKEILANLDSTAPETYARFLSYGERKDIPGRSGYLAGYLIAKELAKHHSLDALASLEGERLDEALRKELRRLADEPVSADLFK